MVAGTPQYMSPEQAEGKAVDPRTDLFSLGSVLYAMCTGRAPFRASGTLAVLKRVCEETPTPIHQTNPGIPEWLVEIIDKLHAKDPARRYPSAAEVAKLLGRHLARVQHPSVVGQDSGVPPEPKAGSPPSRRRRLAVAAAVLFCLAAGLSLSEAADVTNLRATVIRLLTPDGTLVVETDDPAVKVTVEGDGDLVITGAGPQEVRLRAGSYRLRATRGGKPVKLDRDLVAISRGDRQIVRVRLEDEAPAAVVPKAEPGAFVLRGGKGIAERRFDTLAEAVQSASGGDTVEIRGNGPFVSDGVKVAQPLVIRAGTGYAPSITPSRASAEGGVPLLNVSAPLVLEGLELRWTGRGRTAGGRVPLLLDALHSGSLHVANCRLIVKTEPPLGSWPFNTNTTSLSVRNSLLSSNADGTSWQFPSGGRCDIENCVCAGGGIGFSNFQQDVTDVTIRMRGNTLVGNCLTLVMFREPNLAGAGDAAPPIRLDCSGNVARWGAATLNQGFLFFHQAQPKPLSPDKAEAFLRRFVRLDEKQNVYQTGTPMLRLMAHWQFQQGKRGRDRADWDRFWGQKNTGSVEGDIRFQGGDLVTRAQSAPEGLTAEDFRLRPDSAGYRAGKAGKNLGADVDLVGPGPAYERWKKTPDYQQWLKETGQVKK